jgi:hypothetical protein
MKTNVGTSRGKKNGGAASLLQGISFGVILFCVFLLYKRMGTIHPSRVRIMNIERDPVLRKWVDQQIEPHAIRPEGGWPDQEKRSTSQTKADVVDVVSPSTAVTTSTTSSKKCVVGKVESNKDMPRADIPGGAIVLEKKDFKLCVEACCKNFREHDSRTEGCKAWVYAVKRDGSAHCFLKDAVRETFEFKPGFFSEMITGTVETS